MPGGRAPQLEPHLLAVALVSAAPAVGEMVDEHQATSANRQRGVDGHVELWEVPPFSVVHRDPYARFVRLDLDHDVCTRMYDGICGQLRDEENRIVNEFREIRLVQHIAYRGPG